tara:strand:+ start:233 stop:1006 length:774 start_codon:yes stop_codon:yes gene_type:complete
MIEILIKLPIFKRLIPSILQRYYKFLKKNKKYFKIGKIHFYLDFLDPMDREIILNKNYEHDQVVFFEKKIKEYFITHFLDIGANSGYYSFYIADKFKNIKIKSFEPNIDPYMKFNKTLEKNGFKNIEIFNFGLSDIEKKTYIRSMIKNNFVHSNSEVIDNLEKVETKGFEIKSANLKVGDDIMSFKNEKLSIKIDVEGHELFTLKGLNNILKNNNCLLLIEIYNQKFHDVDSLLKKFDYKCIFNSELRSDYVYTNFK